MSYERFESVLAENGYDYLQWSAIEVTTTDDYILTMFHIYNEDTRDSSLGPITFMHGSQMDGTQWLEWNDYLAP